MYNVLLAFGLILWGGTSLWYLRHPLSSVYHPVSWYLLAHGLLFAVRPVLARWWDYRVMYAAYEFEPTMGDKITVLLGADLALIVFVAVALRVGNVAFARASAAERGAAPSLDRALLLTLAVVVPAGLVMLVRSIGLRDAGVTEMVYDAATGASGNTITNGYYTSLALMLGPVCVMLAWAARLRWWSLLPLFAFTVAQASSGARWPFVFAALSLILLVLYDRRARWPPLTALIALAPIAAIYRIVGDDRGAALRALLTGLQVQASPDTFVPRPLESMDYANMEFFEYLVHIIPGRTGTHGYFLDQLQLLTEPVPRVLWPDKPFGSPVKLYSLFDYGNPIGMTYSVPGEGWAQGGWIGIVIWSAVFAGLYGYAYRAFVRSRQSRYLIAAYMIMLPISLAAFRDGIILTALRLTLPAVLPVLLWWVLAKLLPPRRAPEALATG